MIKGIVKAKELNKTSEKLIKQSRKLNKDSLLAMIDYANKTRNYILKEMQTGKKTGRMYKRGKKRHRASAPGEYPAVDTGELLRSIIYSVDRKNMQIELGAEAGAPYAKWLEEGTKKMEPRPWLNRSLKRYQGELNFEMKQIAQNALKKAFN